MIPPSIRIRVTDTKGDAFYIFNRGINWMCLNERGEQVQLGRLSHDPVMFMFALEDAVTSGEAGKTHAQALKAAKMYCAADATCNLVHPGAAEKAPHRERPKPDLSMEAAGLDLTSLMPAK